MGNFDFVIRAWNGREPLGKIFWIYLALVSPFLIIFLFFVSAEFTDAVCPRVLGQPRVVIPCYIFSSAETIALICYAIWVCGATWRCAANEKDTDNRILAKLCVAIYALVLVIGTPAWLYFLLAVTLTQASSHAADQEPAQAQRNLEKMYSGGKSAPLDYEEEVKWVRLVAEQGAKEAQYGLGIAYRDGLGVPADDEEAVKWLRLSADQGFAKAHFNLGAMYYHGQGVPRDYVMAHMWFHIGARGGNEAAKRSRDIVAEMMKPAEVSEAQRLARKWLEKRNDK